MLGIRVLTLGVGRLKIWSREKTDNSAMLYLNWRCEYEVTIYHPPHTHTYTCVYIYISNFQPLFTERAWKQ